MWYQRGVLISSLLVAGMATPVFGAEDKKPAEGGKMEPHAIIKTKFGEMEIKFFPDLAPKHVENFTTLAKSGFYDKTLFHRVIPGFMIQGGDPNTKDLNKKSEYGMGGPGHKLKAEFNAKPHTRGIVSMARSNNPDSAGSQFFIVVKRSEEHTSELQSRPHLVCRLLLEKKNTENHHTRRNGPSTQSDYHNARNNVKVRRR